MKRTLIPSGTLAADMAALEGRARRADEFLEAARWLLERDSEQMRHRPRPVLDPEASGTKFTAGSLTHGSMTRRLRLFRRPSPRNAC